jgi:hypothetical protein
MLMLVKRFVNSTSGKRPLIYGTVSSAITSLAAYGTFFITENLFTIYWILAGIFLLFGIIHIMMTHQRYFAPRENNQKILIGELFFAVSVIFFTLLIFSALLYFLRDRSFLFYPTLMSGLTFFVPLAFIHTFRAAYNIPPSTFKTWRYPITKAIDPPDEDPNERLLVIGFQIAKRPSDQTKTYFRAKTPENIVLGDLYYHFINDYNELQSETPIEFLDQQSATHEWWFRAKPKWYQFHKILDPEKTMLENGVRENTVIICERIYNN